MGTQIYDIAIVGGGASGLMLAAQLELGGDAGPASGIILEGSSRFGSKLLMSGGGHCNITHGGPMKDLVYAYGDAGAALRRCLYRHSNIELAGWLEGAGVPLVDERGEELELSFGASGMNDSGRIFPASMRAADILNAFLDAAASNKWQTETNAKVCGLKRSGDHWKITLANGHEIAARRTVIASGGMTFPETGSDGSVFELLADLGIEQGKLRPALAPVYVRDYPYRELAGISLPDVTAIAFSSDPAFTCRGKAARMKADLLFTHDGLSGPVILNLSKYAEPGGKIRLCYNKKLEELPKRMQKVLRERARGPLGDVRTTVLASLLDHDDLIVEGVDERGMVTAGGVSTDEVDLHSMALKRFDGLYVIGEALDADGITGGYNLQLCWSTAGTAADSLREK